MGDNTALHWASMREHVEIVNYLLQNGANKNMKNAQDKLPIDMCQAVWSDSYKYVKDTWLKEKNVWYKGNILYLSCMLLHTISLSLSFE